MKRLPSFVSQSFGIIVCYSCGHASALEWHGLLDVRALSANSETSWTHSSLGKLRYDSDSNGLKLGQATLQVNGDVSDTVSATLVVNAADDRSNLLNINEAWIGWNPLPSGPWKFNSKAGAFFAKNNIEIDYDSVGWTPARTISSSAINSWLGEEFRTKGLEFNATHRGRYAGSLHDYGFTAALFNGNDAAGTLMAWRGWSISDRITGLSEDLQLPDLEVYEGYGPIPRQSRNIHVFREIDNRLGYYLGAHYKYSNWLEVSAMHYDNQGDPMVVKDGQYSWRTRYNHVSAEVKTTNGWTFLFQGMTGDTLMGPRAVYVDYWSWYGLASHALGPGQLTLRFDQFGISEDDILPSDPNGEHGHALALAYAYPIKPHLSWITEGLLVQSNRPARETIGDAAQQSERSLTTALRWQF